MPLTKRLGSAVADGSVSSRVYVTEPAAASAFFEMKTRPVFVAAHIVPVSLAVRSIGRDEAACAGRAAVVVARDRQVRRPGGPDAHEVAAAGCRAGRRELGAVRLEICLVAAPVLRAPDALRALEDRPGARRIRVGDDRRVEVRALRAARDRRRDDDPLRRVAVLEVRVVELPEERVEPQRAVGDVEAGLAAVAVDDLRPDDGRAVGLERAVVLRAALQVLRRCPARRTGSGTAASRGPCSWCRGASEPPRAAAGRAPGLRRVEPAARALRRDVRERAARAHQPAVPAEDRGVGPGISTIACESGCCPFGAIEFGWQQLPAVSGSSSHPTSCP